MKNAQMRWLPLLLLAAVVFALPACKDNNELDDEDLVGVMTLKMRSGNNEGLRYDHGGATTINLSGYSYLLINNANNFKVVTDGNSYTSGEGSIVDCGKKRLSQVTTLPSVGWTYQTAVQVGHTYIARGRVGYLNYQESVWEYDDYKYIKLRVKEFIEGTSGGIIGAVVQYCEWEPDSNN